MTHWHGGIAEWQLGSRAYLSVVFSWDLPKAYQRAVWYRQLGYTVFAGGPAVLLNPDYLADVAECGGNCNALPYHNPDATFTSRGCIRQCAFCAVPRIEGDLVELDDWDVKPIVCDNNLLACSRRHFDTVVDRLKSLPGVDFNQGLDARLFTKHHAERLAELDCTARLAWDHIGEEEPVMTALQLLFDVGFSKRAVRVYVMIGYNDTPEDALYRLETLKSLGLRPNPMRYQPLDAIKRNAYVGEHWTEWELKRYMRYWARQAWLEHVPFAEYVG
jgi:hypothetical protein